MEIKINQSRNYSSLSTAKTYQEVSSEIEALLNQYKQLKRTRIKTEQERSLLENKMKVLTTENTKIKERKKSAEKIKDKYMYIRVNVMNQKKLVNQLKEQRMKEQELKRQNSQVLKKSIQNTLSSWRIKVHNKNQEDGNKVKKEKELIEKIKQSFKNEIGYYHKSLHDKIYNERCETERAKQKKTIKRRNSMRNYLENELKTEVGIINKLNFRMNCYRSESVKILNRISNIGASKSETKKKNKITNRPKSSLRI